MSNEPRQTLVHPAHRASGPIHSANPMVLNRLHRTRALTLVRDSLYTIAWFGLMAMVWFGWAQEAPLARLRTN